ncbi:ParB N-terminal domain-containing protein [Natronorarus salvus]|uniref:hypothetical protein n=1 Tax=Natronorarus salvus TaxID=3117733 RepID=UPI002F26A06D
MNLFNAAKFLATSIKYYPPSDPYYIKALSHLSNNYTDAEIFSIIWVNPGDIQYCSLRPFQKWEAAGTVKEGDWDKKSLAFESATFYDNVQKPIYPSLEAHFVNGIPWESTPFIGEVMALIDNGTSAWGCGSVVEVRNKCNELDDLYAAIESGAYLTQEEQLKNKGAVKQTRLYRLLRRFTHLKKDEVTVDIGRDGRLLFFDGKHRLSIAKILHLDSIPVRVAVRHREWQRTREKARQGARVGNHPDLEFVNES